MATAEKDGLPGFERISSQIWIQRVEAGRDEKAALDQPTTILLYGWGDGRPKHVAKYTAGFRELFSQSTIIVVFSPIFKVLREHTDESARAMQPIVDLLFGPQNPNWADERILVHAMSNGGGMYYGATLKAYHDMVVGGSPPHQQLPAAMPHVTMSVDSTPGGVDFFPNIGRWSYAMAVGAAPHLPWPFFITQALSLVVISSCYLADFLMGRMSTSTYSRYATNDPAMESLSAERLYLYSKADDIIRWEDIVAHAAEARTKGYTVAVEAFEDSPHVGHMRMHPEQYWGAISRNWTRAIKARQQ